MDGAIRNQALADISMIHLLNLGGELPTELYFEGTRQQAMAAEEVCTGMETFNLHVHSLLPSSLPPAVHLEARPHKTKPSASNRTTRR